MAVAWPPPLGGGGLDWSSSWPPNSKSGEAGLTSMMMTWLTMRPRIPRIGKGDDDGVCKAAGHDGNDC